MAKKTIIILLMAICAGALWAGALPARTQLIEPTRTLEGDAVKEGMLSVLSEPPGMEVRVDGELIGKTPVFKAKFPAGDHLLSVGGTETGVRLEAGKATSISWFKGRFIEIPAPEKAPEDLTGRPRPPQPEPGPQESESDRRDAADHPFYWPLNPQGPIY